MPNVEGKHFPYTEKGKAAAARLRLKLMKKREKALEKTKQKGPKELALERRISKMTGSRYLGAR